MFSKLGSEVLKVLDSINNNDNNINVSELYGSNLIEKSNCKQLSNWVINNRIDIQNIIWKKMICIASDLIGLPVEKLSKYSFVRISLYRGNEIQPPHIDSSICTIIWATGSGLEVKKGNDWIVPTTKSFDTESFALLRGSDWMRLSTKPNAIEDVSLHRVACNGVPRCSFGFFAKIEEDEEPKPVGWGSCTVHVLVYIFSGCPLGDIPSIARVCRHWRNAVASEYLWKRLCDRDGPLIVPEGLAYQKAYQSMIKPPLGKALFVKFPKTKTQPAGPVVQSIKVVYVGEQGTGKTTMRLALLPPTTQEDQDYNSVLNLHVAGRNINIGCWDSSGSSDFDRLRPLSYPPTDLFVIVFSLVDRKSMARVKDRWLPEVMHHCPGARRILVGTQADRRILVADPITTEEASSFAKELLFCGYFETAALHRGLGVQETMEFAARVVTQPNVPSFDEDDPEKKKCQIQ